MKRIKKVAFVSENRCVACGSCIAVCPRDAISIPLGISAVIDHAKCIGCSKCATVCPAYTISIKESA